MDNLKVIEAMHSIIENFRILAKEDRDYLLQKLAAENVKLPDAPDSYADIRKDFLAGHLDMIPAIKLVRERSAQYNSNNLHMGLKEAKDLVEGWRNGLR